MSTRGTISRHSIVDAALSVADRQGLPGVTIRAVAAEIKTAPMSLYTHVKSKEQLLDLMTERVIERVFAEASRPTWEEELEARARCARATLLAHPQWLSLLTRVVVPVTALRVFDTQLERMRRGGLALDSAMRAISATMSFTLGSVLVERMMAPRPDAVVPVRQLEVVRTMLPTLPASGYAQIARATDKLAEWSFDDVFDAGLRSLVAGFVNDGARRRRPTARAART